MNYLKHFLLVLICSPSIVLAQDSKPPDKQEYLSEIKRELQVQWPKSRTINVVFHGHSVPAGYWTNHEVHTLESYAHLVLQKLKAKYPYAVVNVIVTAIGGENAEKGAARFDKEVLMHKPDVLLIDYALNDRPLGLEKARIAWESMIQKCTDRGIKVILVTPSPDQRVDLLAEDNFLEQHTKQIRSLAEKYHVGLADPYAEFKKIAAQGTLKDYMSHVNHPNLAGHEIIASTISDWFTEKK